MLNECNRGCASPFSLWSNVSILTEWELFTDFCVVFLRTTFWTSLTTFKIYLF
jgi:hypothetical protein